MRSKAKAISNFPKYLPEAQSRLAQEITKDNYDFSFVTVPENYQEEQLETALEQNITRFSSRTWNRICFCWSAERVYRQWP